MIQPSTIKLAKVLDIPPEDLEEKYKTNSLNLGQIATIANYMRLTPEFMYRRSLIRREVTYAKKQTRKKTR